MKKPTQRQRALWALAGEPFYPGLRVKLRKGTGVWEAVGDRCGTVLNMSSKRVQVDLDDGTATFWFLREDVQPEDRESGVTK